MSRISRIAKSHRGLFKLLAKIAFWVYTIENSCLVGVAYIANYENYRKYIYSLYIIYTPSVLLIIKYVILLMLWLPTVIYKFSLLEIVWDGGKVLLFK